MHAGAKPKIFKFAEQLRGNMTGEEKRLWKFLRLKPKEFKFRRQHPLGQYILDFYCHRAKLAIEVDGKYHELPKQKAQDERRTNEINQQGINLIRFTNEEVNYQFEKVINVINDYLEKDI